MVKLNLITGDIIEQSIGMDAIVNSQNKYMSYGSGVCGAIYRAAGTEIINYCEENYDTYMVDGEVRITPGFNLNMDIIHVLAPKAYEHKDDPTEVLLNAYKNMLEEIKNRNYKKVILPSLGAGIHGYEHQDIAKPVITLLNDFCSNNDTELYLINMYPVYTNIYFEELVSIKNIDLKNDLLELDINKIIGYLKNNNLYIDNGDTLYKNFVSDKKLEYMCLYEKVICLQYCIENLNVNKEDILPLINSL